MKAHKGESEKKEKHETQHHPLLLPTLNEQNETGKDPIFRPIAIRIKEAVERSPKTNFSILSGYKIGENADSCIPMIFRGVVEVLREPINQK